MSTDQDIVIPLESSSGEENPIVIQERQNALDSTGPLDRLRYFNSFIQTLNRSFSRENLNEVSQNFIRLSSSQNTGENDDAQVLPIRRDRRPNHNTNDSANLDDSQDPNGTASSSEEDDLDSDQSDPRIEIDMNALCKTFESNLIFMFLFLIYFLQSHALYVSTFILLIITTIRSNNLIKEQVKLKQQR